MGDTGDDSSGAAQSAREIAPRQRPGILGRFFGTGPGSDRQNDIPANGFHPETNGHSFSPVGGIGNLNRVSVSDVAVPRAEIISVPVETELETLVQVFRESGLTRLPVFTDTLDNPIGFVHLKDLALRHGFACDDTPLNLKTMVRPLLFAPPSMPIGVLLQKMQSDRIHMALVIDEYGGVDGLVTIEDLIEQVVGEIEDEHDIEEDQFWTVEKPGVYLCLSKTPLEDFDDEIGFQLVDPEDEDEIGTLGGLVFLMAGRVPMRGEVIQHETGVEFEILEADPRRIKRMRVVIPADKAAR
jgi:magnesium and cobalt transporter